MWRGGQLSPGQEQTPPSIKPFLKLPFGKEKKMLSGIYLQLLQEHNKRGLNVTSSLNETQSVCGEMLTCKSHFKSPREPLRFVYRSEKVVPDPADSISIHQESWEPVPVNQSVPFC